ncbi:MAG: TetR/AcrR family transcriptional regulator [Lachnospiraceae bacterium]|nr:TetR/AcrR family transcriptional regulator [Lachnospiraceae bacterium]
MESRTRQRTRRRIQDAFIRLLEQTGIEQITVVDVAREAGTNRSTFYEYYEDVYALQEKIEEEILDAILMHAEEMEQDFKSMNMEDIYRLAIQLLATQGDHLVALLGPHGDHAFSLRLIEIAKPIFLAVTGKSRTTDDLDILFTFEMAGIVGVYTKWCMDGKKRPLDEVVLDLQQIMQAGIRAYL